jgi:hypothetical protein
MRTPLLSIRFSWDTQAITDYKPLIHCHVSHIKNLDIFPKKSILVVIPTQLSHPVNFPQNPNLPEMAMKLCRQKVLKVKPPRDLGSFLEAFSFGR